MSARRTNAERRALTRRAELIVCLWLGFWLLSIGSVLGMLCIPIAQLYYRDAVEFSGIFAACAAGTLAYAFRPRQVPKNPAGTCPDALHRDEVPALFNFIDGIARKLHVDAPIEIHLVTDSTAFISAEQSWTGRIRKLNVGLGLPLFAWLSEKELGAVIAHEFGHYVGGDLALGPWVYQTRSTVRRVIQALDDSFFFLDVPFRIYSHCFLRLSSAVSRDQELVADACGVHHFGAAAACGALEKINFLQPMWSAYFQHDLVPALDCNVRVPVFEGFRQFCAASPKRREVQETIDKSAHTNTSPYDTHPPLQERVEALGRTLSDRLPPTPCLHLLGGEEHAEALWYQRRDAGSWPAVGWDKFGDAVLQARLAEKFAGTTLAPVTMPLIELPVMAQALDDWWTRLKPDGPSFLSPDAKRQYVLDVLKEWIVVSLSHAGFMLRVSPGLDLVLERDDISVEPAALLVSACGGTLRASDLSAYSALGAI